MQKAENFKSGLDTERWLTPPWRTSTRKTFHTGGGNYLVVMVKTACAYNWEWLLLTYHGCSTHILVEWFKILVWRCMSVLSSYGLFSRLSILYRWELKDGTAGVLWRLREIICDRCCSERYDKKSENQQRTVQTTGLYILFNLIRSTLFVGNVLINY